MQIAVSISHSFAEIVRASLRYRYVDWLLTVPLLLIELVLVMGLSPEETASKTWTLGVASALMVALGYPGEVQNGPGAHLQWWAFAMFPFSYVVYTLAVGLEEATKKMPAKIAATVRGARWLTIISWSRESACCSL